MLLVSRTRWVRTTVDQEKSADKEYSYDIALSFAGEDRDKAERLARLLTSQGVRVFYDAYEKATLWGKDLYQHLQSVYRDRARFCIVFVSDAYRRKLWPRHELRQAQARAFRESEEYILPLRIDDSQLPGLNDTTSHVDLRQRTFEEVAVIIQRKLIAGTKCDTWHETPTALSEFSERLRIVVTEKCKLAVSVLASRLPVLASSPIDVSSEMHACLRSVMGPTDLDTEVTCLDESGVFVYHPWPGIVGQTLESQWAFRHGFASWMLRRMAEQKRGYLTWKDPYSSDLQLELEIRVDGRRYERRTIVSFERIVLFETATPFFVAVEGHEIDALGARGVGSAG